MAASCAVQTKDDLPAVAFTKYQLVSKCLTKGLGISPLRNGCHRFQALYQVTKSECGC